MKRLVKVLEFVAEWADDAAGGLVHVGPFLVLREPELSRRTRIAYELGIDAGRLGVRSPSEAQDTPAPVRHLHSVGAD